MRAVILAGGEGTRLRPLTSNAPKPMMPIANRPMMEHIVRLLAEHGFDDIVVTVAFLANHIRNYFADGSDFGVRIRYATEDTPLGTAGSVRNAGDELDDTFLVVAGDVLTDVDLSEVVDAHRAKGVLASIALKQVTNPLEFGIVITKPDGMIERFLEKPTWGQVFSDTINTGIYVLEPDIFDFIDDGHAVDFSSDVFPAVLAKNLPMLGHVVDGYWEDVGTLEAYRAAHEDILDGKVQVAIKGFEVRDRVWFDEGADVSPDARVEAPAIVGANTRVEARAVLHPYSVLGSDVVVKSGALVERSVVHDHVYVGNGARLRGTVVGRSSDIRDGVRTDEDVVIGDECFVGAHAVINPQIKIYPFKAVEASAVVTSSIVWESRGARTLFGRRGVRGLANVDITSDVAVRLAQAYGTSLPKGSVVTTSRDTSRTARALKRAIIGGLNLSGVHVMDLELATVPLTRFLVRSERAQGGISVRLAEGDPDTVEMRFLDAAGRDLDEGAQRKIERLLYREDFRRAFAGDIGDIVFPPRALEFYTAALERSVDAAALHDRHFKVVLDYSSGATATIMPSVLAKIGADVLTVNPYASTATATLAVEERAARVRRLAEFVRTSGSDLGVLFDSDGETATVIDDRGRPLANDELLLVLLDLVVAAHPGARVALPVSVSTEAERITQRHGATIVWAKLSAAHLMELATATVEPLTFAASQEGGFIWPAVHPGYDAVVTFVQLLDLLARRGVPLSTLHDAVPDVHIAHEVVPTPWDRKGTVMREMVERAEPEQLLLVDGVKVHEDGGWALILPDPEEPVTHVWAEGDTDQEARRLVAIWAGRIAEVAR
jgi:mannose-1-phosphate guanylyltransferase/phosphomannomutase